MKRRHEHALMFFHALLNARNEIVHLPARGADRDLRIHEARRANDLLHDLPSASLSVSYGAGVAEV